MDKRLLAGIISGIMIFGLVLFGYFYWKKKDPLSELPIVAAITPPEYVLSMYGDRGYLLKQPMGITVQNGEVYVSDSDAGLVLVFDENGKLLRVIGDKKLRNPYGMAIYRGELYIADGGLGRIAVFTPEGEFKRFWQPKEASRMNIPASLLVDEQGITISELTRHGIYIFNHQGNLKMAFGGKGSEPGMLNKPHGVAVDGQGRFVVTDTNNDRVQLFDRQGKHLGFLGEKDSDEGKGWKILAPRGVTIDDAGNIYVVSGMENRVYVFDGEGYFKFHITNTVGEENISLPNGIASNGRKIYVTEYGTKRISVFSY